ncbi:alpha/beta fold hydrolase [Halalkalibacter urbisdiaboli]|uniref:alpha/beta fold hydrolase n=1 Tax=Halalkalibacter urbisdiaboli TaxID=1960589 RepID=UPI000B451179|nr:alpha/beta hydrolase [Halalkalibacter urbisdiaboli]
MKKASKWVKKIFLFSIVITVVITTSIFSYHHYQLSLESDLITNKGTLVEVNKKKLNVYVEGDGKDTYVFMPGAGIAAPIYEMKDLYSKFSQEHKIALVERAGYGYSDIYYDDRDIDTILDQTRKSLFLSGNKPPYVLVPHSISGIEAIYWAQKYPEEVKGIIALDIGLPVEYVENKLGISQSLFIKGMNLVTSLGIHRLFPTATYDPEVIKQSFLSDEEKEIFKAISFKKAFNNDMEREILQSYDNSLKSVALPLPYDTPILFLSAYTDQDENSHHTIQKNKKYEATAEQLVKSEVIKIKGSHSIYLYGPEMIYDLAMEFIYGNVE